jgi:hypothetical protein
MSRIGTRLEIKTKRDGKLFWQPVLCECGGFFRFNENYECVCEKCGLVYG